MPLTSPPPTFPTHFFELQDTYKVLTSQVEFHQSKEYCGHDSEIVASP